MFLLSDSNEYHIGTNINKTIELTPFEHWQNSMFVISVIDLDTNLPPEWTIVDQLSKKVAINHTLISSVINPYKLIFSARLITYSINNDTSPYTTSEKKSYFRFRNNNWNYAKSNQTTYLVIGKMSIFMFGFEDTEKDKIFLNINDMANTPKLQMVN